MKSIFSYWCICSAISCISLHAMEQEKTVSFIDNIPAIIDYLSAYRDVHDKGYLNANGIINFIESAQSRKVYLFMCGLDGVIESHQAGGILSYPAGFLLAALKVIPGYAPSIQTCEESVKDGAPISAALAKVRHIQRHVVAFMQQHGDTVDHCLGIVDQCVGPHMPLILTGLQAMYEEHRRREIRKKYAALREHSPQYAQPRASVFDEWAYDNDDDDDQYNPIAEYNRIHKEMRGTGYLLNEEAVTVELTNSIIDTLALREAEGRDEGMTDWLK